MASPELLADFYHSNESYDPDNSLQWIHHHRRIKTGGGTLVYLSFEERVYLMEIAIDCFLPGSRFILMKGRQIGASELVLSKMTEVSIKRPGTLTLHTLNDSEQMKIFSLTKIKPIFDDSPLIRQYLAAESKIDKKRKKAVENMTTKEFSNGSIYKLLYLKEESSSKSQAYRSIQSDMLFLDEFAEVEENQIIPLEKGTSASDLKVIGYLGTPQLEHSRFHETYLKSDQRNWYIECPNCLLEQILISFHDWTTWDSHISERADSRRHYFSCEKCGAELDRKRGRWRITNPEGIIKGYYIPQLIAPWISADDFVNEFAFATGHQRTMFIRETLGIPYSGQDVPIRLEWLEDCLDRTYSWGDSFGEVPCYGHDWGNISHGVTMQFHGGKYYIVDEMEFNQPDINDQRRSIGKMFVDWDNFSAVLDSGYGKAQNQELMPKFPSKVWSCFYSLQKELVKWDTATGKGARLVNYHCTTNHAMFVEENAGLYERHIIRFPGKTEADRMRSRALFPNIRLVKKVLKEKETGMELHYVTTPAHKFMAIGYARLAAMRGGGSASVHAQAVDIQESNEYAPITASPGASSVEDADVWSEYRRFGGY